MSEQAKSRALQALAEAAYNGVCLAAENGDTADYAAGDVSPAREGVRGYHLTVRLADGRLALVQVLAL